MPSLDRSPVDTASRVNDLTTTEDDKNAQNGLDANEENMKSKVKKIRIEDDLPTATDDDGWLDILGNGQVKKKVLCPGKGADTRPSRSNWVTVNLEAKCSNGSVVEKEKAFRFILGDYETVTGLDLAIPLMEEGEIALIAVTASLAYGTLGRSPDIPENASLNYEVELIKVEEAEEEKDLPLALRFSLGNKKRERGNFWYGRGEYPNALHCYRRSLEFLDDYDQNLEEEASQLQQLLDMRLKVYNNMAATQLKLEAYGAALKSVENVLMVQPQNVKALFRKGKVLAAKNQLEEAIRVLLKARELEPDSKIIHQELAKLVGRQKSYKKEEKAMYKKMFPTFQSNSSSSGKSGRRSSKLQRFGLMLGSVLVVALGAAVYRHLNTSQ